MYSKKSILKAVIFLGNCLIGISCLLLILGLFGIFDLEFYAYGLSSGIRVVGSLAIAGCLLSAIGNYILEQ